MTLTQLRRYALSLTGVEEAPHFKRTSFRVQKRIFATAEAMDPFVHVFVGEEDRERALALHPGCLEKLFWGGKAVGLRIALAKAPAAEVKNLVRRAWEERSRGKR